jgi:hypothetical protein
LGNKNNEDIIRSLEKPKATLQDLKTRASTEMSDLAVECGGDMSAGGA